MAHEIETTAWTNEKPWHGLGVEVDPNLTPQAMMKAAGLDWQVTTEPLKTESGVKVPDFFALQRSSDKRILDVVGNQYEPVQNVDAFAFFNDFVKAGKAKMETAGSLKAGRMVWGLANLGNSFTLGKNDKVKSYLLVASPHEQGKSLKIMFTAVRVVCNNTLTAALNASTTDSMFRMSHRRTFDEDMIEVAKKTLGLANDHFDGLADQAQKLSKKKLRKPDAISYFASVFMPDLKNAPPDEILAEANKPLAYAMQALDFAPGAKLDSALGTAWGALNAVTYTTDHLLGRTADARLNKAWFGRLAATKSKALELALAL